MRQMMAPLLAALVLCGCDDKPAKTPAAPTKPAAAQPAPKTSIAEERDWTDDELHEYGQVTKVVDMRHPHYLIIFDLQSGARDFAFLANVETLGLTIPPGKLVGGDYIPFYYISSDSPPLRDLRLDGKSLIPPMQAGADPGWKQLTGTLEGADKAAAPGMPDANIRIKPAKGKAMAFSIHVTPDIAAANGKTVTAFYKEGELDNHLTYLKPQEISR